MNGQIIKYEREMGLRIVAQAQVLGYVDPEDPLCVYKDVKGEIQFLTGTDVTQYFCDIMRTVTPSISASELSLISTHLI